MLQEVKAQKESVKITSSVVQIRWPRPEMETRRIIYQLMWLLYAINVFWSVTWYTKYKQPSSVLNPTLDLHLFMMSMNSFLPIPVSRNASAALKLGMLS